MRSSTNPSAHRSVSKISPASSSANRTPAKPNPASSSANRTPAKPNPAISSANRSPSTLNHANSSVNRSSATSNPTLSTPDQAPIASSPIQPTPMTTPSSSSVSNLSLTRLSSASSSSSLSSHDPNSSPLAQYGVNRNFKHIPSARLLFQNTFPQAHASSNQYRHANSAILQGINLTLDRLLETCAFCWATGAPNPQAHHFQRCPLMKDPVLGLKVAYAGFRGGIECPYGTCYGCYVPKVRRSPAR